MTIRLELRHRYPEPPDRMREVLTDPAFLHAKLREVGGPKAELVSREEDGRGVTILVRQTVPGTELPAVVRAVLPGDVVIHRTETWTGWCGAVQVVVHGAPGTITGEMNIEPAPAGSVVILQLEATVALPLFGGKVEKIIADGVRKLMDTEYDFTLNWLRESATP